jgi:hypothetical protein
MFDSIRITARDAAIILLVIESLVVGAGLLVLLVVSARFLKRATSKTVSIIRQAATIVLRVNQVVGDVSVRVVTPIAELKGLKVGLRAGVRRLILGRHKEAPGV